jgi:hypothetical protein
MMRTIRFFGTAVLAVVLCSGPQLDAQAKPAVVAPAKLVALLPAIPGWTKGEPKGEAMNMGTMTLSMARVSYEKDDSSIKLEITDTVFNQMILGPFSSMMKAGFSEKTSAGWRKSVTIGGFPGLESWDAEQKSADVVTAVAGRYLVKASATEVADTSTARKAVEAVDLKALAALK